jgi:hypothetical protein
MLTNPSKQTLTGQSVVVGEGSIDGRSIRHNDPNFMQHNAAPVKKHFKTNSFESR